MKLVASKNLLFALTFSFSCFLHSQSAQAQTDDRICPNFDGNIDSVTVCPNPQPTNPASTPYFGGGGPVNGPGSYAPPGSSEYSGGSDGGQGGQVDPREACREGNPIELCVVPPEFIQLLNERIRNMLPDFGPIQINGSTVYQAGFFFISDFREMFRNFSLNPIYRSPSSGIYYIYCLTPTTITNRVMVAVGVEDLAQGLALCTAKDGEPNWVGPFWLW